MCTINNCYSVSRKGVFKGIGTFNLHSETKGDKEVVSLGRGGKHGRYVMVNEHNKPRIIGNEERGNRIMEAGLQIIPNSGLILLSENNSDDDNRIVLVKVQSCKSWEFSGIKGNGRPVLLEQGQIATVDGFETEGLFCFESGGVLIVRYTDGYVGRVTVNDDGTVFRDWLEQPAPKTTKIGTLADLERLRKEVPVSSTGNSGKKKQLGRHVNGVDQTDIKRMAAQYLGSDNGISVATSPQA